MKKLLILLLLSCSVLLQGQMTLPGVVASQGGAAASTLPNNLISYWKFDESSGSFVDSKALADLAVGGTTTYEASGKIGRCVGFDADGEYTGNYGNKADELFSSSSAFSICFWMYIDVLPDAHGHVERIMIVPMTDGYLNVYLESDRLYLSTVNTVPATQTVYSNVITTEDAWLHAVINVTAGGAMKIYINNSDETGAPTTFTGTISTGNVAGAFTIGGPGANEHFMGRIDEFSVYSRILTASEITASYNAGSGKTYPF